MARRLFNLAAAMSLLLTIAFASIWIVSYRVIPTVYWLRAWPTSPKLAEWDLLKLDCGWGLLSISRTTTTNDTIVSNRNDPIKNAGMHFTADRILPSWTRPAVGAGTLMNKFGFGIWHFNGMHLRNGKPVNGFAQQTVVVNLPLWLPLLLTAILPAIWLRQFTQRRRRVRLGHCPKCGYDMRGTPDRCPECGWAVELRGAGN